MSGERRALIIANDEYEQPELRDLLAPAADAEALGRVLSDPQVGGFAVQVTRNRQSHVIQAQVEDLFADSRPDDLLLLHYSGHGIKSESGELFLAASNTRPTRLRATALSADFVLQCMRDSRSRSIVLFLDCCYAGAFPQGARARAARDINVLDSFPREKSGGRGRGVITASSAMEYAFEGGQLSDDQHGQPSVFTAALVEGLVTGDADQDEDGWVALAELYNYVFDKVRDRNPHQTPGCQFDFEGELYLARSRRLRIRPTRLPPDLQAALASGDMYARLGAVGALRARLASDNLPVAIGAYEALSEVARNDIGYVAGPAAAALGEAAPRAAPSELNFGPVEQGSAAEHQVVRLLGPPIARACAPRPSDFWIRVEPVPDGLDISVDTSSAGGLHGSIALEGPTGRAVIAVNGTVAPATPVAPVTPGTSPTPRREPPGPAPAEPPDRTVKLGAEPRFTSVTAGPSRAQPLIARHPAAAASAAPGASVRPRTPYYFAACILLLIVLGMDANIDLSEGSSIAAQWGAAGVSGLGVVVTLGNVRKSATVSSILLWILGWSAIYWLTILLYTEKSSSTDFSYLTVESAVAAAGEAVLGVWALLSNSARPAARWQLGIFAGLNAVADLLAAMAWSARPFPDRGLWNAVAAAALAALVAGLLAAGAFLSGARADRLGPAEPPSG